MALHKYLQSKLCTLPSCFLQVTEWHNKFSVFLESQWQIFHNFIDTMLHSHTLLQCNEVWHYLTQLTHHAIYKMMEVHLII